MVSDLIAHDSHPFDAFQSHQDKPLRVHMNGVMEGVSYRSTLLLAKIAALFHDLGKLNPNFQPKLKGVPVEGYSYHAYLSAHALVCFCKANPTALRQRFQLTKPQFCSIVAMIAHHHGNLPDFNVILHPSERKRVKDFLSGKPTLPVSDYLRQWLDHEPFDVCSDPTLLDQNWRLSDTLSDSIQDRLGFYLETQFGFSCLIEADKRDAGNNKWFQREDQLSWAKTNFSPSLTQALSNLTGVGTLNQVRTMIREEALSGIRAAMEQGHRTFSLTAPTGAGKTYALLTLADEIRRVHPGHAVIYALPFLTITEQVEAVCRNDVFKESPEFVSRIDSRSQDPILEKLLSELEEEPDKIKELLSRSFSRDTFDSAFIITTFVQLFETLMSNKGSALLRLPNFSKCIFLLDEIQALPPRLYVFLVAYLQAFCEKFDSFAIFSTATMPALCLPNKAIDACEDPRLLFQSYREPTELLDFQNYYSMPVFNRYTIQRLDYDRDEFTHSDLAEAISKEKSCLVILNTIDDTRGLYDELCLEEPRDDVVLLNTRFILDHRREKIEYCKKRLKAGQPIILISTQLIEAGVDIDFPVVFRDLCPLPSLIQSAGRCNRNGLGVGIIYFFELREEGSKPRAELVYRDSEDSWILNFSRERIQGCISEENLLQVQRDYFDLINANLAVGDHRLYDGEKKRSDNLIKRINEVAFEIVGSFRLIDENEFGKEYQYYVPDEEDDQWELLLSFIKTMMAAKDSAGGRLSFEEMKKHRIAIDHQLRQMSGRTVQVRVMNERDAPPAEKNRKGEVQEICGLRCLVNPTSYYSFKTGIDLKGSIAAIF